jgi:hypothetical protein
MSTTFIVFGIAVAGVLFLTTSLTEKRRRSNFEKARSAMTLENIYEKWYVNSGIKFERFREIWMEVGEYLHLDPRSLRPSDRFGIEIGKGGLTTDDLDSLGEAAVKHLRFSGLGSAALAGIKTVDDYVKLVGAATAPAQPTVG